MTQSRDDASHPGRAAQTLCVAHVIGYPNIGGAERHFVSLLNAMRDLRRVAVFVSRDRGGETLRPLLGPEVEQLHIPVRRRSFLRDMGRLTRALRRRRCDVVHTHMYGANLWGALAARLAGVPVVVTTEHGENRWKRWRHRWIERQLISRLADRRLCVSEEILTRRVESDGVPRRKLALIGNGTELPEARAVGSRPETPTVGSVGRLVREKDYSSLLVAMSRVRKTQPGSRLCLVGDGPELPQLRKAAAELNLLDRVDFVGAVNDVADWYRRFDVFVLSSVQEGLPVALLEAMSYGLACVATDVGAISRSLKDGSEGTIVPPANPESLAAAIAGYLGDPARRQEHGAAARARVEREFSIDAVAETHVRLYRRLLTARTGVAA